MKKFKKTISLLIATILFSVTLSNAHAQTVEAKEIALDAARSAFNGMAYMIGRVMGEKSLETVSSSGYFDDVLLSLCGSGDITENDNNAITFSEEAIVQLSSLLDEYFSQEENLPDVVWMPVISSDQLSASAFYSTTQYYQFRSVADDISLSYVNTKGSYWNYFYYKDVSDCVFHNNFSGSFDTSTINYFNYITSVWGNNDTSVSQLGARMAHSNGTSYTFDDCVFDAKYSDSGREDTTSHFVQSSSSLVINICYPFRVNHTYYAYPDYGYVVRGCNTEQFYYVPYFASLNAYKEWVTGTADYYRVQSSYTGGNITVNPNTDYSVVYNNIFQTIQNSYAEGKDYSDILSDIQASYDASMKEISESLGNIEDNTGESNSWLEKIYGKVSNIDNMIAQQFDDLVSTISNGFNSVIDSLTDISLGIGDIDSGDSGSSDGDSESTHKSFWTRLGEFCSSLITGILSLLETVIMKAVDGLLYLANIVVDNASIALNGITEYMERYIDYFGEDTFLTNLGEALPQQIKDLIVFIVFGITAAGVIYMIKR